MDERLRAVDALLEEDELAALAEEAAREVRRGIEGEPRPAGFDPFFAEDDEAEAREHARFMRGGMALRFAARAYALRGDARGLDAVVAGAQALATDRFKGYRQLDAMIAGTVKSVGARVLEVPGLAEQLATSPFAAVRRALARVLPATERAILEALAQDDDASVAEAASERLEAG